MTLASKLKNVDDLRLDYGDDNEAQELVGKIDKFPSKNEKLKDLSDRLAEEKRIKGWYEEVPEPEWIWAGEEAPPDPEEIEKSEARAVVEVKKELPAMITSTITDIATDNVAVGMQKLVDAQNLIDSLPPGEEKDALNDKIVKTMMTFTANVTDPLTGATSEQPLFKSEADARKFIDEIKNRKHFKRLRWWKRPVLWKRLHGEQRGNLSPMTYRTLKSKSPF